MTYTVERGPAAAQDKPPAGPTRKKATAVATPKAGAHRKDIEGLRALSILMIMVWHAGVPFFPGGFVSLDVFFVISGFLITQLLVQELRTTGRLKLRRFYGRRAKRLLPAPTVVFVAVAVLTIVLLPRSRWIPTAQDIIATATYSMNWRLAAESTDYFSQNSTESILEHFWSLSVEEQFYLLWPCLLAYTAARTFQRGRRAMGPALLAAFALVGVPSFLWSVYYSVENPAKAYFVTTTRAWEFALGGALAMLTFTAWKLPKPAAIVVGWAGLVTIFAGAFYITTEFPYPGYWALIPCLGTAAIIFAGFTAGRAGPVAVLGTAPMQVVGRMSYSLYLCHWPVLMFTAAALGRPLTPVEGLITVTASAIPAYLLYRFVENPIRYSRNLFPTSAHMLRAAGVATVVSLIVGMGLYMANWPPPPPFVPPTIGQVAVGDSSADQSAAGPQANLDPKAVVGAGALGPKPLGDQNGAPKDQSASIVPAPNVAANDYTDCTQTQENSDVMSCVYGKKDSSTVVAVVGDSHANQWVPGLAEVATARGWKLVEYTKAACSFADVLTTTKDGDPYPSCQEWGRSLLDKLLTTEKPTMMITSSIKKRVILDGQANFDAANISALAEGLRRNYEALNKAGIPVVVIQDTPTPTFDIPECVQQNPDKLTKCAGDRSKMVPGDLGAEQFEAKAGLDDVTIIDLNGAICPTEQCAAVIGNVLVYRDASHLTGTYVRTLSPRLDAEIGAATK
ncbi:acyltransferase [Mycobacterium manitobense]|uniref:Acyltransferase n=1 Tax=[Mycobacterium] manitobense TaxID=190147 RepID=A0A9X3BP82_9MYCO|nr:acyltransferase family protein [[Mycobacterium] manitobense]MCV7171855.1 acyltransferase [[Mycobacterium] manitobense]